MDPALLIPSPDALPVPWHWFQILLIPCLAIHLLFMNALLGTCIIGWIFNLRAAGPGLDIARRAGQKLPFFMAFTINFGVAVLLFVQVLYGHLFYTSSILIGAWWLSALGLVLLAYAAAYRVDLKFDAPARRVIWTLMVLALLLVGFVFVNNLTLMQDPGAWSRYFNNPGGTLLHGGDATLVPRYLHFVIASVAVAGLALAVLDRHRPAARTNRFMHWFTGATALQFVIGGWFLLRLPPHVRLALTGGDTRATALFAAAFLGFLLSLAFGSKRLVWPSVAAVVFTVLAMVLVRDTVRTLYLLPYFKVEHLTAHAQYSPMLVFAGFVMLGIVAVFYMVRLYLKGDGLS